MFFFADWDRNKPLTDKDLCKILEDSDFYLSDDSNHDLDNNENENDEFNTLQENNNETGVLKNELQHELDDDIPLLQLRENLLENIQKTESNTYWKKSI